MFAKLLIRLRKKYGYSKTIDYTLCMILCIMTYLFVYGLILLLAAFEMSIALIVASCFSAQVCACWIGRWWRKSSDNFLWKIPSDDFTVIDDKIESLADSEKPEALAAYIYHIIKSTPEKEMSAAKLIRIVRDPIPLCIMKYQWSPELILRYLNQIKEYAAEIHREFKIEMRYGIVSESE